MGHEVASVCRSGEETIREVFDKRPDCILMDYFLNDTISGHDAMIKIRKQLQTPVVFITGQRLNIKNIREIKHSTSIPKPISYFELKKAIESVAGKTMDKKI